MHVANPAAQHLRDVCTRVGEQVEDRKELGSQLPNLRRNTPRAPPGVHVGNRAPPSVNFASPPSRIKWSAISLRLTSRDASPPSAVRYRFRVAGEAGVPLWILSLESLPMRSVAELSLLSLFGLPRAAAQRLGNPTSYRTFVLCTPAGTWEDSTSRSRSTGAPCSLSLRRWMTNAFRGNDR